MVTIILTHYNQWQYIFEALDSIFKQTYKNIEIIITDDCSIKFDIVELKSYFRNKGFQNYRILQNHKNLGTVRTVMQAIKKSNGDYLIMFAADDALGNKDFIKKAVNIGNKNNLNIISGKCLICEETFDETRFEFPTDDKIKIINESTSLEQYNMLIFGTIVAIGATLFRTKELKKKKYLKSKNKYIEDWELFLKLSLNKNKITVINQIALYHRKGGISENKNLANEMKLSYLNDFENIFCRIIFKNLRNVNISKKEELKKYYNTFANFYDIKLPAMIKHINKINMQKKQSFIIGKRQLKIILSLIICFILLYICRNISFKILACVIPLSFLGLHILLKIVGIFIVRRKNAKL